jgi:hypothetical protein
MGSRTWFLFPSTWKFKLRYPVMLSIVNWPNQVSGVGWFGVSTLGHACFCVYRGLLHMDFNSAKVFLGKKQACDLWRHSFHITLFFFEMYSDRSFLSLVHLALNSWLR